MGICETGRLSQKEGSLSREEKWDSTRLGKRKVYSGNEELYILVQKAACEKEGRISPQTVWNWKNCAREASSRIKCGY